MSSTDCAPEKKASADGIYARVPKDRMEPAVRKFWDAYERVPGAPLYRCEFGFYSLDAWKGQGMPQDVPHAELFNYDPPAKHGLGQIGWCEAAFVPSFETKVVEDRGAHEVVQDHAGRKLLCFKGRRDGFMPEYLDHPVKDRKTWEEDVKWRMDPATPARYENLSERMAKARACAGKGWMVSQGLIGGYMYLRSLIGPQDLLYFFYDEPELVHDCMQTWLKLADAVIARHQEYVTIDEIFFAEDICYNKGPLISPDMIKEFLLPYYQQVISNLRARQLDSSRHLYVQIDTDGYAVPTIPIYGAAVGMDVMSPFEVASNCDVVQIGRDFPELVISGGIDKRVLAGGRAAIDKHLEYVLPAMRARGGYIPTCDHGVPAEVPYEDYLYYRKRCVELGG